MSPAGKPYFGDFGKRRPVKGGLEAVSRRGGFGRSWWGREFVRTVDLIADKGRMARGRSYARSGQVLSLDISAGFVTGEVQGSQIHPFTARVAIPVLDEEHIVALTDQVREAPGSVSTLAGGKVPQILGPALLPSGPSELQFDCTCPDVGWPCKHAAAIAYLTAERIDEDPLQILRLRGVEFETLMDGIADPGRGSDGPEEWDSSDWFGDRGRLPALPRPEPRPAVDDLDPGLLRRAFRALCEDERELEGKVAELRRLYGRLG
ncbi:SWIM zinc finger family protein [Rhodococcus sp. NPDC058521]|uniref:SWIM zinc finger family protein n=1 Tax=Rhodococcus sp. NPDC058521 TaxID=3346536 RepID=UPI003665B040